MLACAVQLLCALAVSMPFFVLAGSQRYQRPGCLPNPFFSVFLSFFLLSVAFSHFCLSSGVISPAS